jgi:hypothetical protein
VWLPWPLRGVKSDRELRRAAFRRGDVALAAALTIKLASCELLLFAMLDSNAAMRLERLSGAMLLKMMMVLLLR